MRFHNETEMLIAMRNAIDILADRSDSAEPMHPAEMARQLRAVTHTMNLLLVEMGVADRAGLDQASAQPLVARAAAAVRT